MRTKDSIEITEDIASVQGVETIIITARSTPQRHRGDARAQLHLFLNSVLDRNEWSTSLLDHFTLLK